MKYFKDMIECAKIKGVKGLDEKDHTEDFFSTVPDVSVFVFAAEKTYDPTNPASHVAQLFTDANLGKPMDYCVGDSKEILASPFRVISIEVAGQPITSTSFADQVKFGINTTIACIVVRELEANKFDFFIYYIIYKDGISIPMIIYSTEEWIDHVTRVYIKRTHVEPDGFEKTKERIKYRYKGEKMVKEIPYVIHIAPRKLKDTYRSESGRAVDWTCRFLRRAHYRRFWKDKEHLEVDYTKTGKDREGNYCVPGMTFVQEAEVNAKKDLPLIKKQRVVK